MKRTIKILALFVFVLIATLGIAQPPPPPDEDPNTGGGGELGGSAPIGSGILVLSLLGGAYAARKTYTLHKINKK